MLFTSGAFPFVLKVAKVALGHKKDFKIDFSNFGSITLFSNLEKIMEKIKHTRIFIFLNKKNLFYPLQFGIRQKYSAKHPLISRKTLENP